MLRKRQQNFTAIIIIVLNIDDNKIRVLDGRPRTAADKTCSFTHLEQLLLIQNLGSTLRIRFRTFEFCRLKQFFLTKFCCRVGGSGLRSAFALNWHVSLQVRVSNCQATQKRAYKNNIKKVIITMTKKKKYKKTKTSETKRLVALSDHLHGI